MDMSFAPSFRSLSAQKVDYALASVHPYTSGAYVLSSIAISAIFAFVFALHLKSCRYRQKVGGKSCVIRFNLAVIRFEWS